jgi:hypothetical protein
MLSNSPQVDLQTTWVLTSASGSMNNCSMLPYTHDADPRPPPPFVFLAAQPNTIQHWQLRDLLSTSDVANQVYCVYGTHTLRYDTHYREVCHTRRTTRSSSRRQLAPPHGLSAAVMLGLQVRRSDCAFIR